MGRREAAPRAALIIVAAIAGLALPAAADEYDPQITIQLDNDWFGKIGGNQNDRDYTTGIRIAYLSDSVGVPGWVEDITNVPRLFGSPTDNTVWRWGVSINQNIYTPEDTTTSDPIPDDRPYAAWLSLGLTLQGIRRVGDEPVRLDTFDAQFGVVGPWALGEQFQNNFHNVIDDDETQGWDNQLDNEPAIQLTYERRWRTDSWDLVPGIGLEMDAVPYVGLGLGNVQIYGATGSIFRIGQSLAKDFGPPSIRPALPGSESFSDRGFSWYVFGGVQGKLVAHDIFLNGNTFDDDSPSVDKIPAVAEGSFGLTLLFGDVRLSYTHIFRTPEFTEQHRIQQFGSLTFSVSF
jgi:hypothetical protein